jgi:hypothetical protein
VLSIVSPHQTFESKPSEVRWRSLMSEVVVSVSTLSVCLNSTPLVRCYAEIDQVCSPQSASTPDIASDKGVVKMPDAVKTSLESPKLVRVQVEVLEDRLSELNELMRLCGLSTRKDLFNNAISILEWATEEVGKGNVIASVNRKERNYEVLRMPVLDAASRHQPDGDPARSSGAEPVIKAVPLGRQLMA